MVTARRSQFDFAFATKFLSHVKSIQIIVNKNVEDSRADFQNRLQLAWAESPEIDEIIRSSELDARALGGWDGPILSGTWSGRLVMELPDTMFTD